MATRLVVKRVKLPQFSLDLPMAGLAALSVAFVAYAMPDSFFSQAVGETGLPSVLAAAQPPLGQTARLTVIAAAAAGTFLLTWLLLRALGGKASAGKSRVGDIVVPAYAPILRRADVHPDAPSRRPLFAHHDLGEPTPAQPAAEWERPLPTFLAPQAANAADEAATPDQAVEEADPLPPLEPERPTIPHLMQRLELGLIRRQRGSEATPPEVAEIAPFEDPIDRRLRSALSDLQKIASRNS